MDFSKAFDTLHVIILGKLNYYGIKNCPLSPKYVTIRKMPANMNTYQLPVPQVSIFVPILFIIIII